MDRYGYVLKRKIQNQSHCMGHRESELLFQICSGQYKNLPESIEVYRIPLLDFEVRKPMLLIMPMDFETSSTTVGVYLDSQYCGGSAVR